MLPVRKVSAPITAYPEWSKGWELHTPGGGSWCQPQPGIGGLVLAYSWALAYPGGMVLCRQVYLNEANNTGTKLLVSNWQV